MNPRQLLHSYKSFQSPGHSGTRPGPRNFVAKLVASLLASKAPLNRDTVAIETTVPRPSFLPQGSSIANAALAQALPREEADGNFGLVCPASSIFSGREF
jgi:hypothetical protein